MTPEQWLTWRVRNFRNQVSAAKALGIGRDMMNSLEIGRRRASRHVILAAMVVEMFGPAVAYAGEELRPHPIEVGPLRTEVRRERDRRRREAMPADQTDKRWRPPRLAR